MIDPVAEDDVVVEHDAGIEDDVVAEPAIPADDDARMHQAAVAQDGPFADDGEGQDGAPCAQPDRGVNAGLSGDAGRIGAAAAEQVLDDGLNARSGSAASMTVKAVAPPEERSRRSAAARPAAGRGRLPCTRPTWRRWCSVSTKVMSPGPASEIGRAARDHQVRIAMHDSLDQGCQLLDGDLHGGPFLP